MMTRTTLPGQCRSLVCLGSAAVALAGCATTTTAPTLTGSTLTVYTSQPPAGGGNQQAQDVLAAERLALHDAGGQVGRFKVVLTPLSGSKISDNARTAIANTTSAIAYLGELAPGSSDQSIGITSGGHGLLQISPTDTAIALTQSSPAVKDSPDVYYQSLKTNGRTFGRVVPTAAHEATALVAAIKRLRVTRLYVTDDGSGYGKAIALEVAKDARAQGITAISRPAAAVTVKSSGANGLFMGASSEAHAAKLFDDVAAASPKVKLFGASALADDAFASGLSPSAQASTYLTSPGFMPGDLTPAGKKFVSDFKATYGHDPVPTAIFGYEAMSLVLDLLRRAGKAANNPSAVLSAFHSTKNRPSVLGTYTIGNSGDISLTSAPYVFSHFVAGKLVPYEALQG